jgi:DNA invertase Pin-like site-specific DNA recombinase
MELSFIRDRQRTGIEAAKKKGIYQGRPVRLDWNRIKAMHAEGRGPTEIAKTIGCSRGMVYKVLWGKSSSIPPAAGTAPTL